MSKGKNNKVSNNKGQSPAIKSKQFKSQKPVLSKNSKNIEVDMAKKIPVSSAKPVTSKGNGKVPVVSAKSVPTKNNISKPAPLKKEVAVKCEVESNDEEDIDDVDLSDMESYDLDGSEDDLDESDMDGEEFVDSDDFDEIDSDGEIAYAEDDSEDDSDEDDSNEEDSDEEEIETAPLKKVIKTEAKDVKKVIKTQAKDVKKVEAAKEVKKVEAAKEVKKVEAAKEVKKVEAAKEVKKVEAAKEVKKVEAPKEVKKVEAPKKVKKVEAAKGVTEVKVIDASTEGGKILNEMNRRKNILSETSIHVSNIDRNVTEKELQVLVSCVNIHMNKKGRNSKFNRGYCFIKFANVDDAVKAMEVLNTVKVAGKTPVATKFVCKKVMDDIAHVDFSRLIIASSKDKDISEELQKHFGDKATVKRQNNALYDAVFVNKGDAMALFNKETFTVGDNVLKTNLGYSKTVFENNVIPAATVAPVPVLSTPVVAKANLKRAKPSSDTEETIVVKKVKVEAKKTPEKVKVEDKKTPEKVKVATPSKDVEGTPQTKKNATPNNNSNKKKNTPQGKKNGRK